MSYLPCITDRVRTSSIVSSLRQPAFTVLDRIQHLDPADQVRALFLCAAVYADVLRLDVYEEFERAKLMMIPAEAPYTAHIQAIRDYCEDEILRKPR